MNSHYSCMHISKNSKQMLNLKKWPLAVEYFINIKYYWILTDGRVMNWKHCEATAKQVYATIVKYHAMKHLCRRYHSSFLNVFH